jgi:hypothetical protein
VLPRILLAVQTSDESVVLSRSLACAKMINCQLPDKPSRAACDCSVALSGRLSVLIDRAGQQAPIRLMTMPSFDTVEVSVRFRWEEGTVGKTLRAVTIAAVDDPGRRVTLVLCRGEELLGALPPLKVAVSWWPEVSDIIAEVRRVYKIEVVVLRLLRAPTDRRHGGDVTYLAEVAESPRVPLQDWVGPDPLADQPRRQAWARPGGPSEYLAWAVAQLAEQGRPATGAAEQIKTWNLSALWRIPTGQGRVWLKATPPFLGHEGAVVSLVGKRSAPVLLSYRPGLILMEEITGNDNFQTTGPALRPMVEMLTGMQQALCGRTDEVLATGAPDRRLHVMTARIEQVAAAWMHELPAEERDALNGLVCGLDKRLNAITECGVPNTLVHGDFHPGNVRGSLDHYVILDWGDAYLGPPQVDELAFTRSLGADDQAAAGGWFADAWRNAVPGCEPVRAAELLDPVLPLYAAVVYDDFCANIEPDELIYHAQDVPAMLRQAAGRAPRQ